ncbi:MAG: SH3 domain-containing protein [Nitrospinae bacterium]|nr:SH3 domain-containing protein [Nitrospinota bacterium]
MKKNTVRISSAIPSNFIFFCLLSILIFISVYFNSAQAEEYIQVPAAADLRTEFSDGVYSVEELVKLAKSKGIEILIINDHDRYSLEYGFWPLEKILKKKVEESSLLKNGAKNYLDEIDRVGKKYPDMLIIPGIESAPFYYWTGSIFSNNLTAHKWENHIGIVGLESPKDIEGLPTLNSNFSINYYKKYIYNTAFFTLSLILSILLIRWEGVYRYTGLVICLFSLLFIINFHPLRSSPFDQYHGDKGVLPWQETIDYVNNRGGMTFWHHLESASGIGKKGPISINTPPHPEDLIKTHDYTGFQAIYEDTIHVTEPGKEWDMVLSQYCAGNRDMPAWGIGGLDYHGEGESGIKLQDVKTIFLLPLKKTSSSSPPSEGGEKGVVEKTKAAVYEALINGKVYPVRQGEDYRLVLDEFSISGTSGVKAVSGDEIEVQGSPNINIKVSAIPPLPPFDKGEIKGELVEIQLIRNGEMINKFEGETPLEISFNDEHLLDSEQGKFKSGDKIYYRLNIYGKRPNYIISNPIFVKLLPGEIKEQPEPTPEIAEPSPAPEEIIKVEYIIVEKYSAIRNGPGVEYIKIGRVDKGESLELLHIEEKFYKNKPWYKVRYKDTEGFIWGGLAKKE